ncbi:MAG: ArsR family transcriptional regulator [Desulfobacteraceae bacterium]|nr:ArsR family transcriptional regulator [Desulfobacteraceae bacterium]
MAEIDKIIHERVRLLILTYLASNEQSEVSFTELIGSLHLTSGNLSIQLKKLSDVEYVQINKTFKNNKPYTTVFITENGSKALQAYVKEMERIINVLKKK